MTALIFYQTIVFVDLAKLYLKGLYITDEVPGVEDPDFKIEDPFIHICRIVLLVQGIVQTVIIFLILVGLLLLLLTACTYAYVTSIARRR